MRVKSHILHDLSKFNEALECTEIALKIEPEDGLSLNNKGWILESLGRKKEADGYYEMVNSMCDKKIKMNSKDKDAWNLKSYALGNLGKTKDSEKAKKQYEKLSGK